MTQTEALKLALEFADDVFRGNYKGNADEVITAIKEALAQPEQEFVANYCKECLTYNGHHEGCSHYTTPPQPEQEPVAWATRMGEYAHIHWGAKRPEYPMVYEVPLYTTPTTRAGGT